MGYLALLFCPDEKTARTVTQVLGELEFTVEPCLEPFAAVKKLMSQHFDAIVVDCDNEQNATLLFKSARNSASNQASLAVAVVEGQAGVAKAFRIGANLVLTKPINIDQSKGTLRVARGLLRKGEPAKAATPTAPAPAVPAKPAAAKSAPPTKPAAPATPAAVSAAAAPAAVSTPRPASAPAAAPPLARPVVAPAPAIAATASSAPVPAAQSKPQPDTKESISPPIGAAPAAAATKLPAPFGKTAPISAPIKVTPASPAPELSNPIPSGPATPFSGGAASAPAPAREVPAFQPEISPASAIGEADAVLDKPAEEAPSQSDDFVGAAPSFTFGGANVPESSAGRKKVLLVLAAVLVVAAALYAGWSYFQGRASQPVSAPAKTVSAPVATPQPVKPAAAPSPTAASTPTSTTLSTSNSRPAQPPVSDAGSPSVNDIADSDSAAANATDSAKPAGTPASKTAGSTKSSAPLVVKAGSAPAAHAKPAVADTAAPTVPEIAIPGSSAPPPNLLAGASNGPAPVLQAMNISQGVSQGLLIKKVQPQYPRNALSMHVEGAVQLMATVSATGNITGVKVLSGDALLTKAALDAVKQWKYRPYRLNGEPVEIQTQITVNFALPH
jgi:TonB family protein